mgnify:CR=1 FL=1
MAREQPLAMLFLKRVIECGGKPIYGLSHGIMVVSMVGAAILIEEIFGTSITSEWHMRPSNKERKRTVSMSICADMMSRCSISRQLLLCFNQLGSMQTDPI